MVLTFLIKYTFLGSYAIVKGGFNLIHYLYSNNSEELIEDRPINLNDINKIMKKLEIQEKLIEDLKNKLSILNSKEKQKQKQAKQNR